MKTQKVFIFLGVIILVVVGCLYFYLNGLASMWVLNKPDKSPYFVTSKPIKIKNINLPKGTKIMYKKRYFWQTYQQKEPLNEKDITKISFEDGITINWADVPITSIVKFYNQEMNGFTVYADFNKLNEDKASRFSNLWQSKNNSLGLTVKNSDDWSFNKENILDIESCGVNYQRYFRDDTNQQMFLDNLLNALMQIEDF